MSMDRDPSIDEQQLDRAYQAGQRQAEMSTQIASHERRLNAINGSIERGANNTAELTKEIQAIRTEMTTNRAVATALANSVKDAADKAQEAAAKQINGRTFVVGTLGVMLTLVGVIVAVLSAVH